LVLSFELVLVFSASGDIVGTLDEMDGIDGESGNDDKGDNEVET
jgi:hypothetical protein